MKLIILFNLINLSIQYNLTFICNGNITNGDWYLVNDHSNKSLLDEYFNSSGLTSYSNEEKINGNNVVVFSILEIKPHDNLTNLNVSYIENDVNYICNFTLVYNQTSKNNLKISHFIF